MRQISSSLCKSFICTKNIVKVCLLVLVCVFGACENKYVTPETSLLVGKWIFLNNPSETVTFTPTQIRISNDSRRQYMVENGIIYTWTEPFHPLGYAEHPYQLKGDTLYIEKFWFTLAFEYDDVVLIRKKNEKQHTNMDVYHDL